MWDILLQAAAAFVVGAAVGYGFAAITNHKIIQRQD
jgi:uncharacterized membrane-anchored protein YhcB (DUF1043 family)